MKPVSVRFKCFGPYMDEQFIDFSELEKNGLFLICGETGAGKTTILDAICYALYCESSGGQRGDIEAMRCKLADKTAETAVEFIFDSAGKRYKFTRVLKYKTKNLHAYHNCYLWNGAEWEVLETGLKQVNTRAEKLVGLTSSQFRQVIILPQGKFEEFLVSDSKKKEEILVTLFNVQQWSRISDEISRRVNARAAVLNQEKTAIAEGLRRYGCQSLEALTEKRRELEKSLEQTTAKAAEASKAFETAEKLYQDAKLENEAFAQLEKRELRFTQLKNREQEMTAEAGRLNRADRADALRSIHGDFRNAAAAKAAAETELEKAKKSREQAETALAQAKGLLEAHEARQEEYARNQRNKLYLEQARQVYASLDGLKKELALARRNTAGAEMLLCQRAADLENRERELSEAFDAQNRAKDAYDHAQEAYRRGIGGILAQTLEEGEPCPVCGSRSHPDPARQEENHVSEAQLDKLNKAMGQWGRVVSAAMKARAQAEIARNAAQQSHSEALQQLKLMEHNLEQANRQRLAGIDTSAQLEKTLQVLEQQLRSYESRSRQLLNQRTTAEAAHAAAVLNVTQWEKNLADARNACDIQKQAWEQALAESGFANEPEFLAACLEPRQKQRAYQALAAWQADLKAAQEALEEQKQLLSGKVKPELPDLKQARDAAEQENRMLTEKRILEDKILKDLRTDEKKLTARLEACREDMVKLEADQVFARRIAGSHGVGLQRYVLGVMMNSITAQANRLLETVYGGRYRLHRTDETTGRTLKGGLELEVSDSHNSQRRSVRTLSGGEKFLVALSLAIGLSTVVQAQGEGIRLEAMFIDEGFGSLDREAIQDALEILQGIQRSAGVVGIISHVEALTESIPAQLQITKGKNGSGCRMSGI